MIDDSSWWIIQTDGCNGISAAFADNSRLLPKIKR
jgi:hypothetical protein